MFIFVRFLGLVAAVLIGSKTWAVTSESVGKSIYTQGKPPSVPACISCHSIPTAANDESKIPLIAGLHSDYLNKQLTDYKTGHRTDPSMTLFAASLNSDEIRSVSTYISRLNLPKLAVSESPQSAGSNAAALFFEGDWDRKIPACISCHGNNGSGAGSSFPRISGQTQSYIRSQLEAWRSGARANDPLHLMATISKKLTDQEVENLSPYIANFKSDLSAKLKSNQFANSNKRTYEQTVSRGRDLFINTKDLLPANVGNSLNCVNCHLNAGRQPNAAPLWAAFPNYPIYREKTKRVDTFEDRIAGCFQFSMNGHAPSRSSEAMTALVTYAASLAKGYKIAESPKGRGFLKLGAEAKNRSVDDGKTSYAKNCAVCHGDSGAGLIANGKTVFPPLWGPQSFNTGAGMYKQENLGGFIKSNMPLGLGDSLTDLEAASIAAYIGCKPRPLIAGYPRTKQNGCENER